jgi:hypothetical protein
MSREYRTRILSASVRCCEKSPAAQKLGFCLSAFICVHLRPIAFSAIFHDLRAAVQSTGGSSAAHGMPPNFETLPKLDTFTFDRRSPAGRDRDLFFGSRAKGELLWRAPFAVIRQM